MTLLSQLLALFPTLVVGLAGASGVWFVTTRSGWALLATLAILYGLPLAAFRLHERVHPLVEGASHIAGGPYSPWWGGHQIQLVYIAFPTLEVLLRIVPGLFSLWLRAWGSRVGRRVYWTPALRLGDRSLLDVGDDVIFGYDVGISSHLIKRTRKNVLLYVKRVTIGDGVFLGAGCIIGPGVTIEDGAVVDAGAHLHPRARVTRERPRSAPQEKAA